MTEKLTRVQTDFIVNHLGVRLPQPITNTAPDLPPEGIVAKRKFLATRWNTLVIDMDAELDRLCSAIPALVPFEKPDEIRTGVAKALRPLYAALLVKFTDAIDADINAGDPKYSGLSKAVAEARQVCATNAVLATLRNNILRDGSAFEQNLVTALDEIEQVLTT